MAKLTRDGKTAVLISSGFGAGWSTWNTGIPECLTDAEVVQALIDGGPEAAGAKAHEKWPNGYWGGADGLEIHWLAEGTLYRVSEYDGAEGLHLAADEKWHTA